MLFKELNDCEQCPLMEEEICPGGWSASPSGIPIEPPCCSFEDDTDLDKWVKDYYENLSRYEERLEREWRAEREKKRKAEEAKRKRDYLERYCFVEKTEVKRARKRLSAYQAEVSFAQSMAFAINITNEMFHYPERVNVNKKVDDELERLQNALAEAEKKLKEKQKEGRNTEEYKSIS